MSINSFDPDEGVGSDSAGFIGNSEGFDLRVGGLYGSVPRRDT